MKLLLGSWILVSISLILGWTMLQALIANRNERAVRRASSPAKRIGLLGVFTTLAGKLLVGGVAFATIGGLAAEGSLPKPVQDVVSAAAGSVGLEVPSSDEGDKDRVASQEPAEPQGAARRRLPAGIDTWDGGRDCDYLDARAKAATGTTPPARCRTANGQEDERGTGSGSSASGSVTAPTSPEQPPPVDRPPNQPPPVNPAPIDPPPSQPPPVDPPPVDPPPDQPSPALPHCLELIAKTRALTASATFAGNRGDKNKAGLLRELDQASAKLSKGKIAYVRQRLVDFQNFFLLSAEPRTDPDQDSQLVDSAIAAISCLEKLAAQQV